MKEFIQKEWVAFVFLNLLTLIVLITFFEVDSTIWKYPMAYSGDALHPLLNFKS